MNPRSISLFCSLILLFAGCIHYIKYNRAYEIIATEEVPADKIFIVQIRINKKFKNEELLTIQDSIMLSFPEHERVMLYCYLPNKSTDKEPWAIVTAKPNPFVDVFGVSIEEERILKGEASLIKEGKIGTWMDEDILERSFVLQEYGEFHILTSIYPIGTSIKDTLLKRSDDRFYSITNNTDSYKIDGSNNLQIYINNEWISAATEVK